LWLSLVAPLIAMWYRFCYFLNAKRCAWVRWLPWLVPTCEAALGSPLSSYCFPLPLLARADEVIE